MTEKVLKYSRSPVGAYDGVVQQKPWDCGPASAQIVLHAAGVNISEDYLIQRIGTTINGTNHAGLICPILNELLPGSGYKAVWLSREPVTKTQVEQLWKDVTRSIDANRGVILNFEAPPGRGPKGTRGSVSPPYSTRVTTYHYTAGMGYAQDADQSRHIWVADPGAFGGITGYWCSLEDVARLIVPHAYAYAADAPVSETPTSAPPPQTQPVDKTSTLWTEWSAFLGDQDALAVIVRAAATDARARMVLAAIERNNPSALQSFIAKG